MPKKKKAPNKSQLIRDFAARKPEAKPSAIAAALNKKDVDVTAQYVSIILSNDRRKNSTNLHGQSKGVRKTRATNNSPDNDVALKDLMRIKQLVEDFGSIERADAAMSAFRNLTN